MDVGSCLRDRSAFTTRRTQPFSYGMLYGMLYGNKKAHPIWMSITKRNSLYFKKIALFEKSEKYFSESLMESISHINTASYSSYPDGHSHHTWIPFLLVKGLEYSQMTDAYA